MGHARGHAAGLGQPLLDEKLLFRKSQIGLCPAEVSRKHADEKSDQEKDRPGQEDAEQHDPEGKIRGLLGTEIGNEAEIHAVDEKSEEDGGKGRGEIGHAARNDQAGGDDDEDVEKIGGTRDPPRNVDKSRDEQKIEENLKGGLELKQLFPMIQGEIEGRKDVSGADQKIDRHDGDDVRGGQLDDDGRNQDRGQDDSPDDDVPEKIGPVHAAGRPLCLRHVVISSSLRTRPAC